MRLPRLALANPYLVVVSAIALCLIGAIAISKTPADILPKFKTPAVQILTLYPGMPADIVERDMTNRLERWTGQANGISRQESRSMIGVSIVRDFFRPDIDPNTALSQVAALATSDLYYLPPGTAPPMVMPFDPTAPIPVALLAVSSADKGEKELYDIAYFQLRNLLQGIPGAIAPAVYGGKLRRILAYLKRDEMYARGLSPMDVVQAIKAHNVLIPTGNAKIGGIDYQVEANGMLPTVAEMNDIPVRTKNGATVFARDVASVEDSAQIQSNVVRVNGRRQVYIPIYRQPGANTLEVVDGIRREIGLLLARLPPGINLDIVFDQSTFVRTSIKSLAVEMIAGGLLAALMVLLFLGSFRSTAVVFMSIPLSLVAAFIGLYATGNTVNAMTLGGLALAVGRLVDDSIVVLENTVRHLGMGKPVATAALDAASEVGAPVLVATVATVAVFFPVVFLSGMGQFLFSPLALAVGFAMAASYVISMTLVPAFAVRFLAHAGERESRLARLSDALGAAFGRLLARLLRFRWALILVGAGGFGASLLLYPAIGKELMPESDSGQFTVLVRAPTGTRIERTEEVIAAIESEIRRAVPEGELQMLISNIGVLYDWPAAYTPNAGPGDAFIQVELAKGRTRKVREVVATLRRDLPARFAGVEFSFETGGMITAALNMGLPAPINIQVEGNDLPQLHKLAREIAARVRTVPGAVDVRVGERIDYPMLALDLERARVARLGLTTQEVVKNVVTTINSSVNFDPSFWIDHKSGNHYFLGAQYRERDVEDFSSLESIPLTGRAQEKPVTLGNIAAIKRGEAPSEVRHVNIRRIVNVFANASGRDIGGVAGDIERVIAQVKPPDGYRVHMRGEVQSMNDSFRDLGFGFLLATALIYLLLVAQFKSFVDPFIILIAVPLGLAGVLVTLVVTNTTLNVESFMGIIFMVGISVSNSVLLVDFANRERAAGRSSLEAAASAGRVRLRPILMTSIAAMLGLLPMALEIGEGAETNGPLGRAVIGGLLASTLLVLFVVPALYVVMKRRAS
ncbi:MAG: efflux RND transporter permease subunit [Deltaproteobacteria bacterium]|nr:efflux RND transporter permease subunit [Deltaproteobacteria bacterium]